ncbi:dTDP-4-amino-4,6-dideoxygalactose transaminase [Acetobacterium woodii]|uniref:TDP-4-oxo-6-deoxy-D-glucose transaminase RffA1 n=1 Tax=Acetobacterium woodii (strain ATCC 29683 / DSM 1030 / JCM 2381 / KCTC 1655 / WB1) TaxID=931626 RepID=H6LC54_ACEWD|nr:dTDP-4-amino-4,6-dideoxygalactose transaminase [Acetobacterium woodii]AFA49002.1 TDP-4-oxo-6-deoxy-D-glucose transaminase RffA1 [Acetobacterium woodii DSM 1030]
MIPFNKPLFWEKELDYMHRAITTQSMSGDGVYIKACTRWLIEQTKTVSALLTTSGTHALEMAALLCNIEPGDEVIMASYTFTSTANAFVLRGAKIVFVDIRPDTMNIDENLIEAAITPKTKVIVPVHYAGISCEMDKIMEIARKYHLLVIEDAAQGVKSRYRNKALGSIGDFGCYSFHQSKNYSMGEGGALIINNPAFSERAEIIREKGTNRKLFLTGEVDKYSWVDLGSSYLPSEINAAYLFAQLEEADKIKKKRVALWQKYYRLLKPLADQQYLQLPFIPDECEQNGHLFYLKVKDQAERDHLIQHLKKNNIFTVFHYVPLHSSQAGIRFGRFNGEDRFTTNESKRLLRLPLFYDLEEAEVIYIVDQIDRFFVKDPKE